MNSRNRPTLRSSKIKVGITIGDPSGIGPAIAAKAIPRLKDVACLTVIGDKRVFLKAQGSKLKTCNASFVDLNNINHKTFSFGKIKGEYGRASIEYLDRALELINAGEIDCLVTCPISKEAVGLGGFNNFSGHTEYLAGRLEVKDFAMLLLNKYLKVSLVTRHIPIKNVSASLSGENIYKAILLTHSSLKRLFLVNNPRIVVCGLNPHASDNGLIGDEENTILKPTLQRLRKQIKHLDGPMSADVAICKTKLKEYDCVIAMYHDQALIPLKLLGSDTGVNVTLGLPFVRTSPLHGTAFDIADKFDLADAGSLIAAIKLAVKCTLNLKKP